jgi:hypothetical protein
MIDFLLEVDLKNASECFGLSLVVRITTDLVNSLDSSDLGNVVILIFRFLSDLIMDKFKFALRIRVVLPSLYLFSEVSSENSVNNAQRSTFAVTEENFNLCIRLLRRLSNRSDWSRLSNLFCRFR